MKYIRKLLIFLRPYRWLSFLSLVLLVVVALLDLAIPRLVQRIIDQGILAGNITEVRNTFLLMLGISLISTVFAVGNNIFSVRVGESVARDLREALFAKIQSFSFGNLDQLKTGQLLVRLSSDTSVLQRLVRISLRIGTRAPIILLGSVVLMFATSRRLALAMIPLLLVTALLMSLFVSKMQPLFTTLQGKLDRLNTVLQENIAGVRVVKAFALEDHQADRFGVENESLTLQSLEIMQWIAVMGPVLSACINVGIVLVIWVGGLQAMGGELTTGEIVAFINYLQTALGPLLIMGNLANTWAAGFASAERVVEVLETVPEVGDSSGAAVMGRYPQPEIQFQQASFHYQTARDRPVLDGISFEATAGEIVALLGATGSGKTTLVNLIPRFYDVTSGRVLVDGCDVRQISQKTLLKRISIVPQETILFSGTVRDNIRFGNPLGSQSDVESAARIAQAHDFILEMADGYDTRLEARGANLSGGQKQRIAIARALLVDPEILILDDSTSAVDVETESYIQAGIKQWMGNRICLIVAQRISTVLNADLILVLDHGRITAFGTHRELMSSSPIYQEIYESQLGDGPNGARKNG